MVFRRTKHWLQSSVVEEIVDEMIQVATDAQDKATFRHCLMYETLSVAAKNSQLLQQQEAKELIHKIRRGKLSTASTIKLFKQTNLKLNSHYNELLRILERIK